MTQIATLEGIAEQLGNGISSFTDRSPVVTPFTSGAFHPMPEIAGRPISIAPSSRPDVAVSLPTGKPVIKTVAMPELLVSQGSFHPITTTPFFTQPSNPAKRFTANPWDRLPGGSAYFGRPGMRTGPFNPATSIPGIMPENAQPPNMQVMPGGVNMEPSGPMPEIPSIASGASGSGTISSATEDAPASHALPLLAAVAAFFILGGN